MKEQDKTPEEELNELKIDNLPEKEFRVMITKMIKEFGIIYICIHIKTSR